MLLLAAEQAHAGTCQLRRVLKLRRVLPQLALVLEQVSNEELAHQPLRRRRVGNPEVIPVGRQLSRCARPGVLDRHKRLLDCDLHLTPLRDERGQVQGVLCAVARSLERALPSAPQALRVLVVEDNLDSQYLVCEMLKAFGHEADGVGHAEGALEHLARASYDVLFSDVSLPGMSGVDLARLALRAQPALHVIFASGYGEALLRHVEFPFQSLQKPYEIEQLQAALARSGGSPSV